MRLILTTAIIILILSSCGKDSKSPVPELSPPATINRTALFTLSQSPHADPTDINGVWERRVEMPSDFIIFERMLIDEEADRIVLSRMCQYDANTRVYALVSSRARIDVKSRGERRMPPSGDIYALDARVDRVALPDNIDRSNSSGEMDIEECSISTNAQAKLSYVLQSSEMHMTLWVGEVGRVSQWQKIN